VIVSRKERSVNQTYEPAEATAHLLKVDSALAPVVEQVGPLQIRHGGRPYEALVRSILYQQLAGPAAAAIERRFLALYGDDGRVPSPEQMLATTVETFRTAGVSRQKAGYLLDLAAKTHEGVVGDHLIEMPDEEVATHVMAVKGIGRWTADMLLIFCLGRPDILPLGDLGLRNAMKRLYGHPEHLPPKELEALAEPWRPYRSAATWYLWQWLDIRLPDTAPAG
jgi:DNA-3-methyladenine glycosylase II